MLPSKETEVQWVSLTTQARYDDGWWQDQMLPRLMREFQNETDSFNEPRDTWHHDQSASVQSAFVKDVQSMVNVMEDFENPLTDDSQDLLVLDTKEIAPPAAEDALRRAHKVGQMQFDNCVRERLVKRTKPLENTIHRNNINIFVRPASASLLLLRERAKITLML